MLARVTRLLPGADAAFPEDLKVMGEYLDRLVAFVRPLDPVMNPGDIAALVPIVRGAGGVITDWQGGAAYPANSTVAAATPELHAATLAVLQGQDAGSGI